MRRRPPVKKQLRRPDQSIWGPQIRIHHNISWNWTEHRWQSAWVRHHGDLGTWDHYRIVGHPGSHLEYVLSVLDFMWFVSLCENNHEHWTRININTNKMELLLWVLHLHYISDVRSKYSGLFQGLDSLKSKLEKSKYRYGCYTNIWDV